MAAMLIFAYWQVRTWLYMNKKLRQKMVTIFSFYSPTFYQQFQECMPTQTRRLSKIPFLCLVDIWFTYCYSSLIYSSLLLSTTYSLLSKVCLAFIDNNKKKWLFQKKGRRLSYGSERRDLKSINRSGSFWMFWETLPLTLSYPQGYTASWLVLGHYAFLASLFT